MFITDIVHNGSVYNECLSRISFIKDLFITDMGYTWYKSSIVAVWTDVTISKRIMYRILPVFQRDIAVIGEQTVNRLPVSILVTENRTKREIKHDGSMTQ